MVSNNLFTELQVTRKMSNNESLNYKSAGVDIDAGNKLVDMIKPLAKATSRIGANSELGGFGSLFDLKKCNFKDPILVSATDGVGTKLKIALAENKHDTIGIDLVAMSVNDLVVQGAEPLFFLDYFACSKLDTKLAQQVIKGIADGCKLAGCALVGGETAEMPGIYSNDDYDLAGFAVGCVERDEILPKQTNSSDVLIGLKSSGIHSNGFSLVRHILAKKNIDFNFNFNGQKLVEVLLEPTKIYVKSCLQTISTGKVKALAHITGGGLYENLQRVIDKNLKIKIDLASFERPEIFKFLQKEGNIAESEMIRTFNCGIGMIAVAAKQDCDEILQKFKENGEEAFIIGQLN